MTAGKDCTILTPWWYMFYESGNPGKPAMLRLASNNLGNAIETAHEIANRSGIKLIGVCPDIGLVANS